MKNFMLMATGLALATAAGAPLAAQMSQGAMTSGEMKMSAADMKKMKSCQKMSQAAMMKNKGCAAMMKMHPDMMKSGDAMMKDGGMKKTGG